MTLPADLRSLSDPRANPRAKTTVCPPGSRNWELNSTVRGLQDKGSFFTTPWVIQAMGAPMRGDLPGVAERVL
jgi:hypothetical protein